jgi:threonine dehydratase
VTTLPTLDQLQHVAATVYEYMPPSPQINWPLLSNRCKCEVWVKHENHNPTGAFKVRGGLVYLSRLKERAPETRSIVSATRGNHGQSVAYAARINDIHPLIVVPEGNSEDKNRAMRALGAELVVHGKDFDEAVEHAGELARTQDHHRMPSFHMDLVTGVASYALEFLQAQPELSRIYVPIGLGSGICGVISARNALGLNTEIIGVVSENADAYARSLAVGEVICTDTADTIADGMAVRVPSPEALALMQGNVSRIVCVSDEQILNAINIYFTDTHNVTEGAAAAPLAALLREGNVTADEKVGLIMSGCNIDKPLFEQALGANL